MSSPTKTKTPMGWREAVLQLQTLTQSEKHGKASTLCARILSPSSSSSVSVVDGDEKMPDDVRLTIETIHIRSLIQLKTYSAGLDYIKSWKQEDKNGKKEDVDYFSAEEGYILYRKGQFQKCRNVCEKAIKQRPCLSASLSNTNHVDHNHSGEGEEDASLSDVLGLMHVYGQSLYRLDDASKVMDVYAYLMKEAKKAGEEEEVLTNLLASSISCHGCAGEGTWKRGSEEETLRFLYGYPKVADILESGSSGNQDNDQEEEGKDGGEEEQQENYDLMYNAATALALYGGSVRDAEQATSILAQAEQICQKALAAESANTQEINSELAPILCNRAFSILLQYSTTSSKSSTDAKKLAEAICARVLCSKNNPAKAAASNNLAVLRSERESLFDSLKRLPDATQATVTLGGGDNTDQERHQQVLVGMQVYAVLFNRALLCLRMGRGKECREAIKELRGERRKNKGGCGGYDVRADLVEACLLVKENKSAEADKLLKKVLSSNKAKEDPMGMAEVQLHMAQSLLDSGDTRAALALVENLDPCIRNRPGVVSTLTKMYMDMGRAKKATSLLSTALPEEKDEDGMENKALSLRKFRSQKASADFKMQLGLYEDAAIMYETMLESADGVGMEEEERLICMASLVRALSFFDSERAEELADRLTDLDMDEEVELDGEELEKMELPRTNRIRKLIAVDRRQERADRTKTKSKNHEARLRQRAKAREAYLVKLQSEGRYNPIKPSKPDPERWIPKKQRSYNKRGRKGRGKFVGAQGAGMGTEKDAAKLDAAARAAAKANDSGQGKSRSTAHMEVSSGGGNVRRGGKKKGKK